MTIGRRIFCFLPGLTWSLVRCLQLVNILDDTPRVAAEIGDMIFTIKGESVVGVTHLTNYTSNATAVNLFGPLFIHSQSFLLGCYFSLSSSRPVPEINAEESDPFCLW